MSFRFAVLCTVDIGAQLATARTEFRLFDGRSFSVSGRIFIEVFLHIGRQKIHGFADVAIAGNIFGTESDCTCQSQQQGSGGDADVLVHGGGIKLEGSYDSKRGWFGRGYKTDK